MSDFYFPEEPEFHNEQHFKEEDNLKFRSIKVLPNFQEHSFDPKELQGLLRLPSDTTQLCPTQPIVLMPTHFTINPHECGCSSMFDRRTQFEKVLRMIEACLSYFSLYDFSFVAPHEYPPMWQGKYIQGSQSCEIEINIYTDSKESYIVEASRVKGDSKPFYNFYKEFQSLMLNIPDDSRLQDCHLSCLPAAKLSESQFLQAVTPIFNMAKSEYFDSRLEASKIICDLLAHHHDHLQHAEFITACVASLEVLILDDIQDVREHAILAFASIVNIPGYQALMVQSCALPAIFNMMESMAEPKFDTIQVRRESAAIVAALSRYDAQSVLNNIDRDRMMVLEWTSKLELLKCDTTLYNYAVEVKKNLLEVLLPS